MKNVSAAVCKYSMIVFFLLALGCGRDLPLTPERYQGSDELFDQIEANVGANPAWEKVVEIDHSRLGGEAGSPMSPSRVLLFSNPALEIALLQLNPLVGIDLPLRVLAYEAVPGGDSQVIYNSYHYIQSRYDLPEQPALKAEYEKTMSAAVRGIPAQSIGAFDKDTMEADGIVTVDSPYNFEQTIDRVQKAIAAQDDTVTFGVVDFREEAAKLGIDIPPNSLILFGGPAPGAKAMSNSPTLGLDAFCQKFLIWQGDDGKVHLSFNDLLALADRQDAHTTLALRVIDFRLSKTFGDALSGD